MRLILLILATLLLPTNAPLAPPARKEAITLGSHVLRRECLGKCPSFDVTVHADGRLERRLMAGPGATGRIVRSHIPPARFLKISNLLSVLKQRGTDSTLGCDRGVAASASGVAEFTISWWDNRAATRLRACHYNSAVARAFNLAMSALGLDADSALIIGVETKVAGREDGGRTKVPRAFHARR